MTCTNNIKDEVLYSNDTGWFENKLTNDDIISKLNDEKKDGFLSFSWRTAGRLLGPEIIF